MNLKIQKFIPYSSERNIYRHICYIRRLSAFHNKKEIPIDDITWKAVFNESLISNKIKLFQYGKKLPKRFNEINEDNLREQSLWIDSILEINDLIEKDKVTILGDFDMDLWTNYVNKAEELKGE